MDHDHGPVFVSYRHSDGTEHAGAVTSVLRASGLSVWLDRYAMLVGSFRYRMDEALQSGPSAGVLIATPEVTLSQAIQTVEFPTLARLARDNGMLVGVVRLFAGRCQAVEATGGSPWSRRWKDSRGVRKPRAWRGRSLSSSAMAVR